MKIKILFFLLNFCLVFSIFGSPTIKGIVTDSNTNEPIPFVQIALYSQGVLKKSATSDFDGIYQFTHLTPGIYQLRATSVGFTSLKIDSLTIEESDTIRLNISLKASTIELKEFVVMQYKQKLIDKGNTTCKTVVSQESFSKMAVRSASKVSKKQSGVYSKDSGSGNLNIRGARSSANYYYIDGMKVISSDQIKPTSYSNEKYNAIIDNKYQDAASNPLSTFSIDVDNASYTNVRRFINSGQLPPADAVRIEEMINYFSYDYPAPKESEPFSITTEYTHCPWNPSVKLVHIGIQGTEIDLNEAPANNLVFLIDVSGSMSSWDKLNLIKKGLILLVEQLRPQDRVALVVYAGAAGLVLPSTSGKDKETIIQAINNLQSGGSTAGGAGIQLAYNVALENFIKDGNNRIILASDGDFNVGVSSQKELIKLIESKRDDDVFLSVFGVGTGNLRDGMMEQIADKGNGQYHYLDNLMEAKRVFISELGGTLITIAKDVKIQVEFNPQHVQGYRLVGYVNRKLANEDFNDDTKDAGEIGSGHSVTMMYEIIPTGQLSDQFDIDQLKYSKHPTGNTPSAWDDELLTVKCRYKAPKGTTSKLISRVILNNPTPFNQSSNNCKFSSSVASFGMLLRQSKLSKNYGYTNVIELAKESKGDDPNGLRSEFIRIVELVAVLD